MMNNNHKNCHCHEHSHECNHNHHKQSINEDSCNHSHDNCTHSHNHTGCCCSHGHSSCGCDHSHIEFKMNDIIICIFTFILFIISTFINLPGHSNKILFICSTLICGLKIFFKGLKSLFRLKFDENTLIVIAAAASIAMGEFSEAYIITLLYGIGQFLENYAVNKSNNKISALIDITPETAYNELGEKIDPASLKTGDIILVRPGDKVPTDAKIIKGESTFDVSNLTGESLPIDKKSGDELLSGSVNLSASVVCVATSNYNNSTASKIRNYVAQASLKKAETEKFITKFAKIYTPIIIILAVILAIFLPLIGIADISESIKRALTFMIASCPCALVISIPLSYYAAIGTASKNGVLIKGSKHINLLAKSDYITFDKTGTLTTGKIKVSDVICSDISKEEALMYASALEMHSNHPIAKAICDASENKYTAYEVKEHFGKGISGTINGHRVALGNQKLALESGYTDEAADSDGINLYIDGKKSALIKLEDEIRSEAPELIKALRKLNFKTITVLSGDNAVKVDELCKKLDKIQGIGELLPQCKAEKIAAMKDHCKGVIFVGDGVNDAPALTEADVSVSIGDGSSLALETGDATLISPNINALSKVIRISRYTVNVIYSNIIFSLAIKFAVLILATMGKAPIWTALFADVGVLIITIINALSILYKK